MAACAAQRTTVSEQDILAELEEQHRQLEQSLQDLTARRTLTSAEQHEVARLKKQKLLTKDRIARLASGSTAAMTGGAVAIGRNPSQ
jgi:hypothetical protein